jgi:hypothetical protein
LDNDKGFPTVERSAVLHKKKITEYFYLFQMGAGLMDTLTDKLTTGSDRGFPPARE